MKIEAGYDIAFDCAQDVPMLLMLSVHPERQQDLLTPHRLTFLPDVGSRDYLDVFGNISTRLVAPRGRLRIRNRFIIADSGKADQVAPDAEQWDIDRLPNDVPLLRIRSHLVGLAAIGDDKAIADLQPPPGCDQACADIAKNIEVIA